MKKNYKGWITVLGFAGAVFLSACNSTSTQVKEISIIPLPNSIVETSSAFVPAREMYNRGNRQKPDPCCRLSRKHFK